MSLPSPPPGRSDDQRRLRIAAVAVVVVSSVAVFAVSRIDRSTHARAASVAVQPSGPSPSSGPTELFSVVGLPEHTALALLHNTGFETTTTRESSDDVPAGTVISQDLVSHPGLPVEIVVSSGPEDTSTPTPTPAPVVTIAIRSTVSRPLSVARRILHARGFELEVRRRSSGYAVLGAKPGEVIAQHPSSGSREEGSTILLVVADPPPCARGYSPCIPYGPSDYDCGGGSGDPPFATNGPYRVTGSDPYDLDGDGDGWGCEG